MNIISKKYIHIGQYKRNVVSEVTGRFYLFEPYKLITGW